MNLKRFLLCLPALALGLTAHAQVAEGYYRIQNASSNRYLSLLDNKGWVRVSGTADLQYDLNAIRTLEDNEKNNITSNPATVIYITRSGSEYVCAAQGTDTRQVTSHTFKLTHPYINGRQNNALYEISAEKSGATVKLYDIDDFDDDTQMEKPDSGYVGAARQGRMTYWRIIPLESNTNNYLGLRPTVEANGKYYLTYYAGYPFRVVSDGITVYYVSNLYKGNAVIKAFDKGDVIPAATPVLIECASANAADNKIQPVINTAAAPSDNQLTGVYFRYKWGQGRAVENMQHDKMTAYNANTMRLIAVDNAGKPVFKKMNPADDGYEAYIAPNTAYLNVPVGSPDELPLMTLDSYTTGITNIAVENNSSEEIYTLSGLRVNNTRDLPHGIYIVNGKKVVK